MSPVVQRDQSETTMASMTRFGPQKLTVVLRVLDIIVGIMFFHLPIIIMTRARGAESGSFFPLRRRTRQSRAAFGHMSGSS